MWWLSYYTIVLHPKKENFNIYDEVINLTVMQESQLLQNTCQYSEFVSNCMKQLGPHNLLHCIKFSTFFL